MEIWEGGVFVYSIQELKQRGFDGDLYSGLLSFPQSLLNKNWKWIEVKLEMEHSQAIFQSKLTTSTND